MSEITPSQTVGPFFAYGLTPKGRAKWDPNGTYSWEETVGRDQVVADGLLPAIGAVRVPLGAALGRQAVSEERADGLRWRDLGHDLVLVVIEGCRFAAAQHDVEAEGERPVGNGGLEIETRNHAVARLLVRHRIKDRIE